MSNFLTLSQLRNIEQLSLDEEIDLIERAGRAVAHWVGANFTQKTKILVIVGRGNNGSDGIAAAISLQLSNYKTDLIRLFHDNTPTNQQWFDNFIKLRQPLKKFPTDLSQYDLIIDAIYGIGLSHELDIETAKIIQKINSGANLVCSLDAPSGVDPFTGKVFGDAVYADTTLTFISDKPGLHTGDGLDYSGEVEIIDLIDYKAYPILENSPRIAFNLLTTIDYNNLFRFKLNSNKGNYGTVAIIGGSRGMHGSLHLAGRAALLSGVGKVVLAHIDNDFEINANTPELIYSTTKDVIKNLQAYDAIAIGPGLGMDDKAYKILDKILEHIEDGKLLVDADALNLIAKYPELQDKFREVRHKIITPHPGEAARLLNISVNEIQNDRFGAVTDLAIKLNSLTLLKGAGSLIMDKDHIYINSSGNPALANAGQGDTLTGIIIGLLGQELSMLDATRLGVFIHGYAADRLVLKHKAYIGILASQVADEACVVINELVYGKYFK